MIICIICIYQEIQMIKNCAFIAQYVCMYMIPHIHVGINNVYICIHTYIRTYMHTYVCIKIVFHSFTTHIQQMYYLLTILSILLLLIYQVLHCHFQLSFILTLTKLPGVTTKALLITGLRLTGFCFNKVLKRRHTAITAGTN